MKKYLIVETFPSFPHFETAMEIAINLKKKNNEVYFYWCGFNLPWTDWKLGFFKKLIGMSFEKKINKAKKILNFYGIKVLKNEDVSTKSYSKIENFVEKLNSYEDLNNLTYENIKLGKSVISSFLSIFKKNKKKIYNLN